MKARREQVCDDAADQCCDEGSERASFERDCDDFAMMTNAMMTNAHRLIFHNARSLCCATIQYIIDR